MPNWKKVVVSGSNADLNQLKAASYYVPLTGSGSVPEKGYNIPFLDTSSAGLYETFYQDNQNKLVWYPSGGFTVIGNITAGGTNSFITASNIIASTSLTGSNLFVNGLPVGTTETRILVSDTSGNIRYRTNLSLTGPTGPKGSTGAQGAIGPKGPKGETGAQGPQQLILSAIKFLDINSLFIIAENLSG